MSLGHLEGGVKGLITVCNTWCDFLNVYRANSEFECRNGALKHSWSKKQNYFLVLDKKVILVCFCGAVCCLCWRISEASTLAVSPLCWFMQNHTRCSHDACTPIIQHDVFHRSRARASRCAQHPLTAPLVKETKWMHDVIQTFWIHGGVWTLLVQIPVGGCWSAFLGYNFILLLVQVEFSLP